MVRCQHFSAVIGAARAEANQAFLPHKPASDLHWILLFCEFRRTSGSMRRNVLKHYMRNQAPRAGRSVKASLEFRTAKKRLRMAIREQQGLTEDDAVYQV